MNDAYNLQRLQMLLTTGYIGRNVVYWESVTSTMEIAASQADAGAPEGAIVLAEEQTAGRGRMGRSWVSPPRLNVYLTVVLRPTLDQLRYISVIAPLAVCQSIEESTGLLPRIKWPNDVVINERKVCGILVQSELSEDEVQFAVAGIGINVNLDVSAHEEISQTATSLRAELGREADREEVLAATLNHFETLYEALRRGEVVSMDWKQRLDTLGKHVRISSAVGLLEEGIAVDADSDGALILRRDDGSHVRVDAGEVTLRET